MMIYKIFMVKFQAQVKFRHITNVVIQVANKVELAWPLRKLPFLLAFVFHAHNNKDFLSVEYSNSCFQNTAVH